MTYMVNGKQYIVIAVSGGPYSGEYIAFTLPAADEGQAAAIEIVHKLCPAVDARIADLETHEFPIAEASWDLIAVCYYLQRDLFEPVKRGVKPGGVALVIVHIFEPGHEQSRFSLHSGELAKYFDGWEILHSYEGQPNDPEHKRAVSEIVAGKPTRQ